jgi:hemerythrin superfamily protein
MDDQSIKALETIELAVAKSTEHFSALRKRADDLYEDRVQQIAKDKGCDLLKAHALAAEDEIASRAYSLSSELAEREAKAITAAQGIAAYIE